jgi:predicted nucleic acid-binding protein
MKYLLDTNILLRQRQIDHLHHQVAVNAIKKLRANNHELCIFPQNLYEYWVVATRPTDVNGLGLEFDQAQKELELLKKLYSLHLDKPETFLQWEKLIITYQIKGKRSHDVKIIACMIVHQIENILTFNTDDFKKFTEIIAINPQSI